MMLHLQIWKIKVKKHVSNEREGFWNLDFDESPSVDKVLVDVYDDDVNDNGFDNSECHSDNEFDL